MYFRLLSTAVVTFAAAAGFSLSTAAEDSIMATQTRETLVAQATGYDPMRPATPSPGPSTKPEGNPELGDLIDAPGVEETYYMCSACHSIALVRQQRLTDARWDYLWTWMIEEQGMADPGEELQEMILGYLKEHYSSQR